jgi:hypothetical protein
MHEPEDLPENEEPNPTLLRARERVAIAGTRRAITVSPPAKLLVAERRAAALTVYPEVERPQTRADCKDGPRPCPWVSCVHHLYLDVNPTTGAIKLNHPRLEVWDMKETCSLDVADRGPVTLEEVGELMNITRERTRQIELAALGKLTGEIECHSNPGPWAGPRAP